MVLELDLITSKEKFLNFDFRRLNRFYMPDGTPIAGHPPYMSPSEFDTLHVGCSPENIRWIESKKGLKFLVPHHFGEWLDPQAAAINSATFSSLSDMNCSHSRAMFSAQSIGKYKSKKSWFSSLLFR